MEIILLERVEKLGQIGDVVKVKPGFARNYLLPQKKALRATKANLAVFEKQRVQIEANNLELKAEAEKVAGRMNDVRFVVVRGRPGLRGEAVSLDQLDEASMGIDERDGGETFHAECTERGAGRVKRQWEARLHFGLIIGQTLGRRPHVAHHAEPFDSLAGGQLVDLLAPLFALRRLIGLRALHVTLAPGSREVDRTGARVGAVRQDDGFSIRRLKLDRRN